MAINSIDDIIQDSSNPNKGNKKGRELIEHSIQKFGAGRSILIDKHGKVIAGNNVHRAAKKAGLKVRVIETTGDELVVVQRKDIDINSPEGRELSLADNVTAKTNITWDKDVLKKEFKDVQLKDWGIKSAQIEIKSTPLKWIPSIQFKSSNPYEIPDLLPEVSALRGLVTPVMPWGAQKRGTKAPLYHFYVDDYRFQTIWDKPEQVIETKCISIVEPNMSTDDSMPMAYGIYLIFKKRWFSRLMQEAGIRIYVDLHVTDKFRELNFMGVPKGWNAFSTRGYADDTENLVRDIELAREHAGTSDINMIVYGGGVECREIAASNGCFYLEPFTQKHKRNENSD